MPVAPSFEDLLAQGMAEAQTRRPSLQFYDGDVSLATLHGGAAMSDACIRFGAQAFRETFIDGARGDALTALVDDHYGIQRQPSTQAQATVSWSRPSQGGGEPGGTIPAGTTIATEFDAEGNEVQFTTDANLVFGVGVLGPLDVSATAVDPGTDGNVAAASIVRVIDVPSFDATFQVTNAAAAGGGNDEESDTELRRRARDFWSTLRRGTLAALEYGAQQVDSVRVAKATEDGQGLVTVRVTDADGNSTAEMVADVEAELENWRCAGVNVTVLGGDPLLVDFTAELIVRAGFDVLAHVTELEDAATARMAKLKAGETCYLDMIDASIIAVYPDDILKVTLTAITVGGSPASIADIVPGADEVIRAGTLTIVGA